MLARFGNNLTVSPRRPDCGLMMGSCCKNSPGLPVKFGGGGSKFTGWFPGGPDCCFVGC